MIQCYQMAATFTLSIVTPERTILSTDAAALQVPSINGSLGILAGHAPLLAELGVGECLVKQSDGKERQLVIAGGFLDVSRSKVTVLADTAEFAEEIDLNRAEAALSRARELLGNAEPSQREEASAAARRAQARLRVARGGDR
jgi:F-type H+-transporting ATPase subunit epsilon